MAAYAKLLARTARVSIHGEHHLQRAISAGRPLLFAAWHGQSHLVYPLIRGWFDLRRIVLMVVDDHRRHVLDSFARAIHVQPFPIGAAQDSIAGARNLLELLRLLREGRDSYITPDGPDGPARVAKPGVAFLAARAGALVLPIGCYSAGALRLRRWDRYALPLLFARIHIALQEPMSLSRNGDSARFLRDLATKLDTALWQAEARGELGSPTGP